MASAAVIMIVRFDEFEIDVERLELRRQSAPVKADAIVLRLLSELVTNAGQLVTKEQLMARVWDGRVLSENVITVAMTRLRKTLGHERGGPEFVTSVHGRGYRFVRPVVAEALVTPSRARATEHRGLPLVGREEVMRSLRVALYGVEAEGGALHVLSGEAGIGKTSVAEVIAREVGQAGASVAWGHCRESGETPPLWPFIQLLRAVLDAATGTDDPRLASDVAELRIVLPDLDASRRMGDVVPPHAPLTHRLFDVVLRVLVRIAARTRCVLVLDDLHRADSASLELLRYVIDELARTRLFVVATLRTGIEPDGPASAHLAYVLGHRNTTRHRLERLGEQDVRDYVGAALGKADVAVARAVFTRSEGNPFFMVEYARMLRERPGTDEMPSAALDLFRQRVARLAPATRETLSVAAVIGTRFNLALLGAVSSLGGAALRAALDCATLAELVVPVAGSRTAFRFSHDLIRTVLHDALGGPERRGLHFRVLGVLERRVTAWAVPPADLAHHAYAALPDVEPRRVVAHCRSAATAAAERRAYADAVRHVRHAREALGLVSGASPRLALGLLLQHALYARICSAPEFDSVVEDALHVARAQGAAGAEARAALMLDLHPGFPAQSGARAALLRAQGALSESDDALPAVLARLATSGADAYDAGRAGALLGRAESVLERTPSVLGASSVLGARLFLQGGPGGVETSTTLMRLERLCADNPATLSVTPVLVDLHRAIVAAQVNDEAAVASALDRAARRSLELGHHELAWHAERFRIMTRWNAGDRAAEGALRVHHAAARRGHLVGTAAFMALDEALVLAPSGVHAPDRQSLLSRALEPHEDDLPSTWAWKVRALTALGEHDLARASLRRVSPSALDRLPRDRDHLGTLGASTRAALALDEPQYLRVLERLLRPFHDHVAIDVMFIGEGRIAALLAAIVTRRARGV